MVLQKNVLFSGTVRENMQWGDENATDEEIIKALKQSSAYGFIFELPEGLDARVEQGGTNFSGGQKQRVAIARALSYDPDIILADEPTGNLDTANTQNVVQILRKLAHEDGCTVIIVTHDPAVAEQADVVLQMRDGQWV